MALLDATVGASVTPPNSAMGASATKDSVTPTFRAIALQRKSQHLSDLLDCRAGEPSIVSDHDGLTTGGAMGL